MHLGAANSRRDRVRSRGLRHGSRYGRYGITHSATCSMKIPLAEMSDAALDAIIESFVLREGTDYGPDEYDLATKCRAVRRQLEAGEAEIDFDPASGTVDIRPVSERGCATGFKRSSTHEE